MSGMACFVKMKIMNEGHKVNHSKHIIVFGKNPREGNVLRIILK